MLPLRGEETMWYTPCLAAEGNDLVTGFSEHCMILSGRGLFVPIHNSLLMMLTLHKRDVAAAVTEIRDCGQEP